VEGSGDFVGLEGGGDWSVIFATPTGDESFVTGDENVGVETMTGDIKYTS